MSPLPRTHPDITQRPPLEAHRHASQRVRLNEPVLLVTGLMPLFIGVGTVTNVGTVIVGSLLGLLIGNRLPERTRTLVTQSLGLITVVLALMNAWQISSTDLKDLVGSGVGMIVLVMALLFGSIIGSALKLQDRVEGPPVRTRVLDEDARRPVLRCGIGDQLQDRLVGGKDVLGHDGSRLILAAGIESVYQLVTAPAAPAPAPRSPASGPPPGIHEISRFSI